MIDLFMGIRQNEKTHLNKRQFLESLEKLPKWHQTAYYSLKLSLHECKTEKEMRHDRKRWLREIKGTENHARQKGRNDETQFELKLRDVSIKGAAFLSRLTKKWLSYAAGWMISNVPIVFAHLMGLWKKFKGGWHCKKGKRPSTHRRDD